MDKKDLILELRKFKKKIESKYHLQKMILFGSRAEEKNQRDSDVDLIIVSKDYEGIKSFKRSPPLYAEWEIDLPVDFVCYTPEEYKKLSKMITIARESKRKGIEIK